MIALSSAPARAATGVQVHGPEDSEYGFPRDIKWFVTDHEIVPFFPELLVFGYYEEQVDGTTVAVPFQGELVIERKPDGSARSELTEVWELGPPQPANMSGAARSAALVATHPTPTADANDPQGRALAASRDGGTVVGFYDNGVGTPYHAFRWTEGTATVDLGTLVPANNATLGSFARAVSDDGSIAVGFSDMNASTQHAFRWTQSDGMVDLGTGIGPGGFSRAFDVSGDGSVIVGHGDFPGGFGTIRQAFRWTQAGGLQSLGSIQPDWPSLANAVTADGTVIVGHSGFPLGGSNTTHAFRWTQAGGMQDLGVLPGFDASAATDVSDDGTIVVGFCTNGIIDRNGVGGDFRGQGTASRAFHWTQAGGMKDLTQLLTDAGAAMDGVSVVFAGGISHDGTWISCSATTSTTEPNETVGLFASLTYTLAPESSRLLNLSTRGQTLTADNVLIPGFVISGSANKRLLIRAVGPTLGQAPFNVAGVLPNPRMVLKQNISGVYQDFATNDDWRANSNAAAITQTAADLFAFPFGDDREAALLVDLPPGIYTAIVDGVSGATGVCLIELYDADDATTDSRLINISTRGFAGPGDQVMIPGFVISSESDRTLLIRVVGPSLPLGPHLIDPKLELYRRENNGSNTLIATQDNWGDDPDAATTASVGQEVFAFSLTAGSKDAAFVRTLPPGSYTVVGSSAIDSAIPGGTGLVLVEVYVVP